MRIAIIGCGRVVERFHLPVLRKLKDVVVVGASDPSPARRSWLEAAVPDVPIFADAGLMVDRTQPQAVLVAAPPASHKRLVMGAVRRGLHVLVEKPVGVDGAEAQAMVSAAEEAGVVLQAGYNRRFHPLYRHLRSQLAARRPLSGWEATYVLQASPHDWDSVTGFLGNAEDGGSIHDLASHAIDILPWLFSSAVVGLEPLFPPEPWRPGVEFILQLDGGVRVTCRVGHAGEYGESLEALHPDGAVRLYPAGVLSAPARHAARLRSRAENRYWVDRKWIRLGLRREPMLESFRAEWAGFVDTIRGREPEVQACAGGGIVDVHRWLAKLRPGSEWSGGERPSRPTGSRRVPLKRVGATAGRSMRVPGQAAADAPARSPEVSIVLVVGRRRGRSSRALQSVLEQEGIERAEVILVDMGPEGSPPLAGSDHPAVKVVRCETMLPFGVARAEAAKMASSPIVAFLEEHSRALPGWLTETLRAFRGPWSAVGPRVVSANPNMGFTDAMGKINYGEWSSAQAAHEAKMLPGNNSAYRRQALIDLGDQLPDLLMTDTVLQARLMALGGRLFLAPSAVVAHRYPVTLWSAAKGEYLYHIGFAGVRADVFEWSGLRRLGYAAASVVIPWLRLGRLVRGGKLRPADGRLFLGTILLLHAAVFGQAVGVLLGMRHAALRFTDYELNEPRPARDDPPGER